MGPDGLTILSVTLYKISCLALSAGFCWLGYRLFSQGLWGSSGDLEAKFKDLSLVLRNAAPGTFFAVLGAGIAVATVWKGFDIAHDAATSQQLANIKPAAATEVQHPEKDAAENPAPSSTFSSSYSDKINSIQAPQPQKRSQGMQ